MKNKKKNRKSESVHCCQQCRISQTCRMECVVEIEMQCERRHDCVVHTVMHTTCTRLMHSLPVRINSPDLAPALPRKLTSLWGRDLCFPPWLYFFAKLDTLFLNKYPVQYFCWISQSSFISFSSKCMYTRKLLHLCANMSVWCEFIVSVISYKKTAY